MKYEKEIKAFIGTHVEYDTNGGGYIWGKLNKKGDSQMIGQVEDLKSDTVLSIRGWGAIQHLFKTENEMIAFQDELGVFIQDAINEKLKKI